MEFDSNKIKPHSVHLDRSIRLFTYLRELTQLRSKIIRTYDNYEEILWLSEIPKEKECFTQLWGAPPEGKEDIWIEIKKPKIFGYPTLPKELAPWVKEADLSDSSKDEPELRDRILAPPNDEEPSSRDSEPQFLELKDNLQIIDLWDDYLKKKWRPWAQEHRRLKKAQEVYATLFSIYQKQKRLGEAFETVLAFGVLNWQSPTGLKVCRHVITCRATIRLDSNEGTITVCLPSDGANPALEQDMLEASERPIPEDQTRIEKQVESIGDDIWNIPTIETVLRSWVQSLSAEGTYSCDISRPTVSNTRPTVTFSPALIIRKRPERGLIRMFQEIINQLESGAKIPLGIMRTVDVIDDHLEANPDNLTSSEQHNTQNEFKDIYFPLPANEEQLKIVESLNTRQGVLVQGPPGTGKSHTIANLICHLLATGKRVLVTSQTPRALKVLKDKIPTEMSPLCVSLLGNDSFALKDLEDSVQGILDKYQGWNNQKNKELINQTREERDQLQRKIALLSHQLGVIREDETYEHNLLDGTLKGTALQIAKHVSTGRSTHEWMQISIPLDKPSPLTNKEALELLNLYREFTPDQISEMNKTIVPLNELPKPEEFTHFVSAESHAKANFGTFSILIEAEAEKYSKIKLASTNQLESLKEALVRLITGRENLLCNTQPWVTNAVNDVLSEFSKSWQELYKTTSEYLQNHLKEARVFDQRNLILPQGYYRSVVMADAVALHDHLQKGGGLGFLWFRPGIVKKTWYLISQTRIDGNLCKTIDSLKVLIETLRFDDHLEQLWKYWKPQISRMEGSRFSQVGRIEDLLNLLKNILELEEIVKNVKSACSEIPGLSVPRLNLSDEIKLYNKLLEAALSEQNLIQARKMFLQVDQLFRQATSKSNVHPLIQEGYQAISARDEKAYNLFYSNMVLLNEKQNRLMRWNQLETNLYKSAPDLAHRLSIEYLRSLEYWHDVFSHFTESWRWAQAKTFLEEYIKNANEERIIRELGEFQKQRDKTVAQLAAAMAWGNCFAKMKHSEREHLIAWKQAMKRIGKGTGKQAGKYRREAREEMEGCRTAIPAWIMPLYRVAESVKPQPDAFDVVIIDEASQAGIDATFLQYIGKQVIVVGDDEQISPESIGIPREDVDLLRERYINDLPSAHRTALGIDETSFFHLADILFSGRIILTEHFRCMPEIIQFSNQLCYQSKPLLPLRQYPPDRLSPTVKAVHVQDGYREGSQLTPRNQPEADAIVQKIAECCNNPAYQGKSMGVISLLGDYQSELIQKKLLQVIGPEEIENRNLICGDAYAFQGDERDIMFISLVAAPGETAMRALTDQKAKRRFNVAASRARDQMWLYHTPLLSDFRNKECLRYKLINYCQNPQVQSLSLGGIDVDQLRADSVNVNIRQSDPSFPFDSWFEVDMFLRIVDKGYRVIPQFEVAGYSIDLVIEGMKGRLAVECDGDRWHGPEEYEADMTRQRILQRCGWTFNRVRGSEFYFNPDQAMEPLWRLLDRLHIAPGGVDSEETETETTKPSSTMEPPEEDENPPHEHILSDLSKKILNCLIEEPEGISIIGIKIRILESAEKIQNELKELEKEDLVFSSLVEDVKHWFISSKGMETHTAEPSDHPIVKFLKAHPRQITSTIAAQFRINQSIMRDKLKILEKQGQVKEIMIPGDFHCYWEAI